MTSNKDAEVILRFSRVLENYLRKFHSDVLWHTASKKGPNLEGPVIQFRGGNTQLWRLWWKVREDQMIMEFGQDQRVGRSYLGLIRDLDLPQGVKRECAEGSSHPMTDYLILPTKPVDLTKPLLEQREVVDDAIGQALRLVALKPQIKKLLDDQKEGSASPAG